MAKSGQFGYLKNVNSLEDSFVRINIGKNSPDRFQYTRYDITSETPKELQQKGWILPQDFIPIHGSHLKSRSKSIVLLNWKTAREDYLLKKVHLITVCETRYKPTLLIPTDNEDNGYIKAYQTCTPATPKSKIPQYSSVRDLKSALSDCKVSDYITGAETETDEETILLAENGYVKDKHLCFTLKGEMFIANNLKSSEPVCIKKIPNPKAKNCVFKSECEYFDFFQNEQYFYFVTANDFGANLKEFVGKCKEYIDCGKLDLSEYRTAIRDILWKLSLCIANAHQQNVFALDMCIENVFLSHSDFIQKEDGSVMINPEIECKFIDFGVSKVSEEKCDRNSGATDVYYFGNICFLCFMFEPFTGTDIKDCDLKGYNLERYLGMHALLKWIVPKALSLLRELLDANEENRVKTIKEVLKHKYFRRFYGQ